MQGATAAYPVAVILTVAHDSPAVGVIQYGACAAHSDCGITAGVGCGHGGPHFSADCIFGVSFRCALLCIVFFFSSLLLLLFGSRLRRQVGILTGRYLTCGCGGGCFKPQTLAACLRPHLPLGRGGRCELFPFQLLYALLQDFKRAVFADHSFFLIWDL